MSCARARIESLLNSLVGMLEEGSDELKDRRYNVVDFASLQPSFYSLMCTNLTLIALAAESAWAEKDDEFAAFFAKL